ncbi:hypothetical protein JYK02_20200 [Corallococcus macrosporus]|uniref:Uncharacterized protein n=1 Tax=Corallococcus macrosporus TaxID=35 RepID=A0ABS3DDU2_9BACT|nr:hypothetical protein [Corallococcus macrosporus]MBN8229839.1 hypothetical protein [Corallococcus macrosporus]
MAMDRPGSEVPSFLREGLGWLLALLLLLALLPSLHLGDALRAGEDTARVWWKTAATMRRHAAPFVLAELESWWHEALAARSAPRPPRA